MSKELMLHTIPKLDPKSTLKALWVNEATYSRVREISDETGVGMQRLSNWLVNVALDWVRLESAE